MIGVVQGTGMACPFILIKMIYIVLSLFITVFDVISTQTFKKVEREVKLHSNRIE